MGAACCQHQPVKVDEKTALEILVTRRMTVEKLRRFCPVGVLELGSYHRHDRSTSGDRTLADGSPPSRSKRASNVDSEPYIIDVASSKSPKVCMPL